MGFLRFLSFTVIAAGCLIASLFAVSELAGERSTAGRVESVDADAVRASMARMVARAADLRRRAREFDQQRALDALPTNPTNGGYFRFDEHFEHATISAGPERRRAVARRDAGLRFEFTDDDAIRLRPVLGGFEVRDGVLRLTQHNNDLLVTDRPISIARDGYGAIELRIKMRKGSTAILYWCRYLVDLGTAEGRRKEKARIARLTVNTIPDGQFHTYVIDARTVLQKKTSPGSKIRSLGLLASSADGDVVEIDYLRFVPKREKYARRPAGRANETIAREMRSVLYVNTPLVLDYEIDVPDDEPTLRFGMGVLEDRDPVRFTASIDGGEGVEIVHAEEVSDTSAWRDAVIDLSRWSGRQVRVSLRADSAGGNVAFWSNPAVTSAQPSRINVILVLEDALRADHLSLYGHERETSPEKTRFARDGVVFEHAYSQATKTRPSCPSFMTSLFPSATGVVNHSTVLDERYLTLAEVMRSQGFVTASLPQNSNAGPAGGLHQGFSYVYDRSVASTSEALFGGAMLPWLEQHGDRNFFLYLHAINPHGVYDPKPPHDAFYRDEGPGKTPVKPDTRILDAKWVEHPTVEGRRLLYDGEVLDNDYWFGKLLADLERLGLRDDTLIVTIADHGEHLGEHGRWGHTPPGFVQVTHVPLVMVHPQRLPAGLRVHQPVQLIDLMPTILELAGIDRAPLMLQGDSLLPLVRAEPAPLWDSRVVVSEEPLHFDRLTGSDLSVSAFFGDYHLLNSASLARTRLYNVRRDHQEETPIEASAFLENVDHLVTPGLRQLYTINRALWREMIRESSGAIRYDPDAQEQLRQLGYIE